MSHRPRDKSACIRFGYHAVARSVRNGEVPDPDVHLLADVPITFPPSLELESVSQHALVEVSKLEPPTAGGVLAKAADGDGAFEWLRQEAGVAGIEPTQQVVGTPPDAELERVSAARSTPGLERMLPTHHLVHPEADRFLPEPLSHPLEHASHDVYPVAFLAAVRRGPLARKKAPTSLIATYKGGSRWA